MEAVLLTLLIATPVAFIAGHFCGEKRGREACAAYAKALANVAEDLWPDITDSRRRELMRVLLRMHAGDPLDMHEDQL